MVDRLAAQIANIKLVDAFRYMRSLAMTSFPVFGIVWYFGQPYFEARAEETVTAILEAKGMGPAEFKNVQKQLDLLTAKVAQDYLLQQHTSKQQDDMQDQLNDNQQKLNVIEGKTSQTYDLLLKLLPSQHTENVNGNAP